MNTIPPEDFVQWSKKWSISMAIAAPYDMIYREIEFLIFSTGNICMVILSGRDFVHKANS